jgi:hypothetical protein
MKFIRRQALTPHTRIDMVRLAWLHQGIYGKMTQIAQDDSVSKVEMD